MTLKPLSASAAFAAVGAAPRSTCGSSLLGTCVTGCGGGATAGAASETPYSMGYASAWLQLGTNWLCSLLYLWTLIAPKLFPERDFEPDPDRQCLC